MMGWRIGAAGSETWGLRGLVCPPFGYPTAVQTKMAMWPRAVNGPQGHTDIIMELSDQSLDHFVEIYAADFGKRLSREDAKVIADRLLSFVRLITRPSQEAGDSRPQNDPVAP